MGQFIITDKAVTEQIRGKQLLANEDFNSVLSSDELFPLLKERGRDFDKILFNISYEEQLKNLQI